MMKLRILLFEPASCIHYSFHGTGVILNDVTCMKADDNIAVITASGTAEKKERCI